MGIRVEGGITKGEVLAILTENRERFLRPGDVAALLGIEDKDKVSVILTRLSKKDKDVERRKREKPLEGFEYRYVGGTVRLEKEILKEPAEKTEGGNLAIEETYRGDEEIEELRKRIEESAAMIDMIREGIRRNSRRIEEIRGEMKCNLNEERETILEEFKHRMGILERKIESIETREREKASDGMFLRWVISRVGAAMVIVLVVILILIII